MWHSTSSFSQRQSKLGNPPASQGLALPKNSNKKNPHPPLTSFECYQVPSSGAPLTFACVATSAHIIQLPLTL